MLLLGGILALFAASVTPEYTLSLQNNEWRVRVTMRPGDPEPGKVVELYFDVARSREADVAEPQALSDGKLGLTITGPGRKVRLLARPLGDAGVYGAHWTPSAKGLWTLAMAPYGGAPGPQVSFQVGAGVPMPASAQGHAVQSSRVVMAAGDAPPPMPTGVKQIMEQVGDRWLAAADADKPDPAEIKLMAALLRAVKGKAPREAAASSAEYDQLAESSAAAVEHAASRADLESAASGACLQCHLKFRDGWVGDLSKWPEVQPWKR